MTIYDGVKSIGNSTFEGCTSLTTVSIGSGVKSIGNKAFAGCKSLSAIEYNGTIEQWTMTVRKNSSWCINVPREAVVHCINGDVNIYS